MGDVGLCACVGMQRSWAGRGNQDGHGVGKHGERNFVLDPWFCVGVVGVRRAVGRELVCGI